MFLDSGIHLSQVAAIARVRKHLDHLFEVALPKDTLEQNDVTWVTSKPEPAYRGPILILF
jgi:hypothetical protein